MRSLVLNLFFLVLQVSFDLSLDVYYKRDEFFKTLLEKRFKFISTKKDDIFAFHSSFILLSAEVNPIVEKKSCKKDALMSCSTGCIKIIFTLSIKVIAFYMQAFII